MGNYRLWSLVKMLMAYSTNDSVIQALKDIKSYYIGVESESISVEINFKNKQSAEVFAKVLEEIIEVLRNG